MSEPYVFLSLGLAFERKADAQVIGTYQKRHEAIEGLELSRRLAKQVRRGRGDRAHACASQLESGDDVDHLDSN